MREEAERSHADALINCKQLITSVENPILLKYKIENMENNILRQYV